MKLSDPALPKWHDSRAGEWVRRHPMIANVSLVNMLAFGAVGSAVLWANKVIATIVFIVAIVGLLTAFILINAAHEDRR